MARGRPTLLILGIIMNGVLIAFVLHSIIFWSPPSKQRSHETTRSSVARNVGNKNDPEITHMVLNVASGDSSVARISATSTPPRQATIFISIASYRDPDCATTIRDLYKKSLEPSRLYLGIAEQHEDKDPSCTPEEFVICHHNPSNTTNHNLLPQGFCPYPNIRIKRYHPKEAKGPTFGRHETMLLYQGETFYFMIDSHNRFITYWDDRLISMWMQAPSKKAILSHYPLAYENEKQDLDNAPHSVVLCTAGFLDYLGYVRIGARAIGKAAHVRPQPFTCAGFLFGPGEFVREVPFDPHLDFLFDGEEILYTVRLWTHGWDFYAPGVNVIFHLYGRPQSPKVWYHQSTASLWPAQQKISEHRVRYFLKSFKPNSTTLWTDVKTADQTNPRVRVDEGRYGLGRARTSEAFWKMARVDVIRYKTVLDLCVDKPVL